ncbi:MAG: hypothetical protein V4436_02320 [Patescibacteria group bacterium]
MTFLPFDALSPEEADTAICVLQIIESLSEKEKRAYRRSALKELSLLVQKHGVVADEIIFAAIIHTHMDKRQEVEKTPGFDNLPEADEMKLWSRMFSEAKLFELVAGKEGKQLTEAVVEELQERFTNIFCKLSSSEFFSTVYRIEYDGATNSRKVWEAGIFKIPTL